MNPVSILVVGVGEWGRAHARTIAGLTEAELFGVVDPDESAIERLGADLPALRAWRTVASALDEATPDACIIATRTAEHVPIAVELLERSIPVLIEKPLAPDRASVDRLAPLVDGASANLMMGHVVLFAPAFRRLLREAPQRGPVAYFDAVRHRPQWMLERFPEEDPIRMTMVHDFYLALALMHPHRPEQLHGRLRRRDDGRADLAEVQMRWPGGTFGSFTASFLTPPGMPDDGFDRFEVFGEQWAARMQLNPQPMQVWDSKAHWPMTLDIDDAPEAPSGWLAEQLRCFCRVVRRRASVPVGARYEDARAIQDWMDQLDSIV